MKRGDDPSKASGPKKAHILAEMIWPEVAAARQDIVLALLPVGSTEQHGPNATFQTDTARSLELGKRLAERLHPSALLLPPVAYGISHHHMAFPGTISLRSETLIAIILDVGASLKEHGIDRLLIMSGHGGNRSTLSIAVTRLRRELGMRASWIGCLSDLARDIIAHHSNCEVLGHADEFECSQALDLCPWVVRAGQLVPGDYLPGRDRKPAWWGNTPDGFEHVTRNGALGDASRSSIELGRQLSQVALDRIEAFARSYFLAEQSADPAMAGSPAITE